MSSTYTRAFRPLGTNRTTNATIATAATTLSINDRPYGTQALRLFNSGVDTIFIELVDRVSINPTLTTSMPLLPNSVEVFTISVDTVAVRAIGVAGGNVLYATYGEGL